MNSLRIRSLFIVLIAAFAARADDFVVHAYKDGLAITQYCGDESDIVIPSYIDGLPVRKIAAWAFGDKDLERITIPFTVTRIADKAFYGCKNLAQLSFTGEKPVYFATAGLPPTLTLEVWPGMGWEQLGTEYQGHAISFREGQPLPEFNRLDGLAGRLFHDQLVLGIDVAGLPPGLVLRYNDQGGEPDKDAPALPLAAGVLPITSSLSAAIRWFTADGVAASGIKQILYGNLNAPEQPQSTFDLVACYCQDSLGRLEIEGYHGIEPVVKIPQRLDGKDVFNLCGQGQWSDNCLAVIMPANIGFCGNSFAGSANLEYLDLATGLHRLTPSLAEGCPRLRQVVIPPSIQDIDQRAFANCPLLSNVSLPGQLRRIGDEAFANCRGLTSLVISPQLVHLGSNVFAGCTALASVYFAGKPPHVPAGHTAFLASTTLFVPANCGWEAYNGSFAGARVEILNTMPPPVIQRQDGVASSFFTGAIAVSIANPNPGSTVKYSLDGSVPIADSPTFSAPIQIDSSTCVSALCFVNEQIVSTLACRTFQRQDEIPLAASFNPEDGSLSFGGVSSFMSIPATVKGIAITGIDGLRYESGSDSVLQEVFIGNAVQFLTPAAYPTTGADAVNPFQGHAGLQAVEVHPDNPFYCAVDGILYDQHCTTLLAYPPAKTGNTFTVPASVRWIAAGAFAYAYRLEDIVLPVTLEHIGDQAFANCFSLQHIALPNGVTFLAKQLFLNCTMLNAVTLPDHLHAISSEAFRGCAALSELSIPYTIEHVAISAFFACQPDLALTFAGNIPYFYGNHEYCDDDGNYLLKPLVIHSHFEEAQQVITTCFFGWDWPDDAYFPFTFVTLAGLPPHIQKPIVRVYAYENDPGAISYQINCDLLNIDNWHYYGVLEFRYATDGNAPYLPFWSYLNFTQDELPLLLQAQVFHNGVPISDVSQLMLTAFDAPLDPLAASESSCSYDNGLYRINLFTTVSSLQPPVYACYLSAIDMTDSPETEYYGPARMAVLSDNFTLWNYEWPDDDVEWDLPYLEQFYVKTPTPDAYWTDNGVLFYQNTLIGYPTQRPENIYVIPQNTTEIGSNAFGINWWRNPPALDHLVIPDSVTELGDALADIYSLQAITFLGAPPYFTSSDVFPQWLWDLNAPECVVHAFPGCGWEELRNRWLKRCELLRGTMTDLEWDEWRSSHNDWTFFNAADIIIAGVLPPVVTCDANNRVEISCVDEQGTPIPNLNIYYSLDGSHPGPLSTPYTEAFFIPGRPTTVMAIAYRDGQQVSATTRITIEPEYEEETIFAPWPLADITTPDGDWARQTPYNALPHHFQITLNGPGTLSFWWKLDSYDAAFSCHLGDPRVADITGYHDWDKVNLTLSESGTHTITWVHQPAADRSKVDVAYLGGITWTPATTPTDLYNFTISDGHGSGQYAPGSLVSFAVILPDDAWDYRLDIRGLTDELTGDFFIMPANDVAIRPIFRKPFAYELVPGWNLLATPYNKINYEGNGVPPKVFIYDQEMHAYSQAAFADLMAGQGFWVFCHYPDGLNLRFSGEQDNHFIQRQPGWNLLAGGPNADDYSTIWTWNGLRLTHPEVGIPLEKTKGYWYYLTTGE
ncbi:leucine-rich repeat protein [Oligosphaera ethanolica]|uniref:GH29D-like beta-sandwich domain-containing protein n=1 Tax=Oligosphaera ethanolica TaxID=760260 RepID=A0AAE4APT0_9BACT|nr:leucine-rich repeat protein [Oligosphaera ethanolica]MDQ0291654.1 hypothetical protein [Oligosphaera ethanolica]